MSKGDLSLVELKGVADDVQRNRKLEELVDALEVAPLFKSLEGTANVPLRLLQCWCLCMGNGSEAHSHLVHHLKCIGLTNTAYRYCCSIMVSQSCVVATLSLSQTLLSIFSCAV